MLENSYYKKKKKNFLLKEILIVKNFRIQIRCCNFTKKKLNYSKTYKRNDKLMLIDFRFETICPCSSKFHNRFLLCDHCSGTMK